MLYVQIIYKSCFAGRRAGILKRFEFEMSCGYPTFAAKQVFNMKSSRDVKHDRYRFRQILKKF